ncbi:hypothetical protein LTR62_004908 [Meristemomyces frigidus]|uniref:DUF4484 domain-containing protein n=1 Tax=Meristemomyces frigidus TaxID=1508187 RepID=A0AAN7YR44_9PEZI|nr:hypothetical protein LTR62_004908 [Meristemomyces frigidus]
MIPHLHLLTFTSYTIAWQCSIPGLDLSGVEYKSLPSGLHGVQSDLIYYIHDRQYAGISAFAQEAADKVHRNASFCAVGALVALDSNDGLSKSWEHAVELQILAKGLLKRGDDKRALELYWEKHRLDSDKAKEAEIEDALRRRTKSEDRRESGRSDVNPGLCVNALLAKRSKSLDRGGLDRSGVNTRSSEGRGWYADHPGLRVNALLDTFGPLIFPLHRAALLRQRILMLGAPPVQHSCNAIHNLTLLSSIPKADVTSIQLNMPEKAAISRPLFSVGITDIPALASDNGWIATTTDDILGDKHMLYDLLVELVPSANGVKQKWPRLRTAEGKVIKASQRDFRRYQRLQRELQKVREDPPDLVVGNMYAEETASLLKRALGADDFEKDVSEIVEPLGWTAAAYSAALWCTSAGISQLEAETEEEEQLERDLLEDAPRNAHVRQITEAKVTPILDSYFRALNTHLVTTLADLIAAADDDPARAGEGAAEDVVCISADDVRGLGLDPWNENDRLFITQMVRKYFASDAEVGAGEGWSVCGVRIC